MPRKATPEMEPEKVPPVHKASLGPLQLAIWANEHQTKEGDTRVFHTISIERNFKDKNDKWQKTHQLREGDLGDAIALLQNAQGFLIKEGV